ncbi:hypothetical protein GGH92_006309 [Coemansia sp. RSA 2673]|nr:hypothetical protein GGH92_006309 [Coemansia sp. RSA 2673]
MTDLSKCQVLHMENGILVHDPSDFVNANHHTHSSAAKHAIEKYPKYTTEGMLYIVDEDGVTGFECNNLYNIDLTIEKDSYFVFTSRKVYERIDKEHDTPEKFYEYICSHVKAVK